MTSEDMTARNRASLAAHPFRLAPMAGVTDAVYRGIFREHGCPLAYTEMISVAGLAYDSEQTWRMIQPAPQEDRVAVQLFGSKPEQFAPAAASLCERLGERLALIDINMACPVPKVFKKGEGCALMGMPERAERILAETIRGCAHAVPVTVKMRLGIRADEPLAVTFARRLEAVGADGFAVHGRTAGQLYRGVADWDGVDEVARAVSVPVMGSGDVMTPRDAVRRLTSTAVSGVLVARGSYGNPWFFAEAEHLLRTGEEPEPPSVYDRLDALRTHIRRYAALHYHMARLRPMVGWYVKGLPAASVWRNRAMACEGEDAYLALVDQMEDACREHGMR